MHRSPRAKPKEIPVNTIRSSNRVERDPGPVDLEVLVVEIDISPCVLSINPPKQRRRHVTVAPHTRIAIFTSIPR